MSTEKYRNTVLLTREMLERDLLENPFSILYEFEDWFDEQLKIVKLRSQIELARDALAEILIEKFTNEAISECPRRTEATLSNGKM